MKITLMVLIWGVNLNSVFCQTCQVFNNKEHEILATCGDSIIYRLINKGGVKTYSYTVGGLEEKSNRLLIRKSYYPFAATQVLKDTSAIAETSVWLLDSDFRPMKFATIKASFDKKEAGFYTDSLGRFTVPEALFQEYVVFDILYLGNTFRYKAILQRGSVNRIISRIPNKYGINNSDALNRKCLKVKMTNEGKLDVYDPVVKEWKKFYRVKENVNFQEAVSYLFKS